MTNETSGTPTILKASDAARLFSSDVLWIPVDNYNKLQTELTQAREALNHDIEAICTAYESGYGHGSKNSGAQNPYFAASREYQAYQYGYQSGIEHYIEE